MPTHIPAERAGKQNFSTTFAHCANVAVNRIKRVCRPQSRLAILALGSVLAASGLEANPFYVSPNGNDSNAGTEAAPFRTIERARTAVRSLTSGQSSDIVVYLREGRYEPADTLRFDGNDSGQNGHRVIYRSYPGEQVSISGGRRVTGWSHLRDGIYQAASPVSAYRQLYIEGQRGVRARTPDTGFHRISSWNGDGSINVPAYQVENWSNLQHVEMAIHLHWHQSKLRVGSFSKNGDTATIYPQDPERTVQFNNPWPNSEPNQAYFFENSLDFLDQPGEWYLDRNQQQVYYMPRSGEDISNVEVIAPRLERLLEIKGAKDLDFIGLTFEHTNWTVPDSEGFVPVQSHYYRTIDNIGWIPSGIHLESTQHVRLERNVVRNMGGGGIGLAFGTYQTQIVGNAIADIAGNGISVYTILWKPNPPEHEKSRGDVVRNNYVTRVGQDFPGAVGILGLYPDGMIVEHNEIYDTPYTGISVGWGWTSNDTALRNNIVRYNRIHQVMNLMDDGAGIYTLSKQPGTLIEENHISDMTRNSWAGNYAITALYLDEQSEGITLRNNVVQNLSGVNLFKQNRVRDGANTVHDNGDGIPNQDAIIANAGLQNDYLDVRDLASGGGNSGGGGQDPGPFSGEPISLPGTIEAEDFNHGGSDVAYRDNTAGNQGGQYRTSENVDIEPCGDTAGGYNIGWTATGEWLDYTVEVGKTGSYDIHFRVASQVDGGQFRLRIDGTDVTGLVGAPNTGGWQEWTTVTVANVELAAGELIVRLCMEGGEFNINHIDFEPAESAPTASYDQWQDLHFSSEELTNSSISGPTADPFGTGVVNLLNYAFDRDPRQSTRENLPVTGEMVIDNQRYLTLTYVRRTDTTDLSYFIETCSDMQQWRSAENETIEVSRNPSGNVEKVVIRSADPISNAASAFLRIRVTRG